MLKKINKKYSELSISTKTFIGILISALLGFTVSVLLSLLFSYILSNSPEVSSFINIYFIISILFGSFTCGFTGNKLLSFNGLLSGLTCSILYLVIIISFMLIFSDGNITLYSLVLFIFSIFVSVIGGIVSANMKRRK
ncbi:MAG: TIGR04086 family membrane protein [Clostridia bacterium]|nr:TIGR04086 family membrane protein [Clostridia bacterium]